MLLIIAVLNLIANNLHILINIAILPDLFALFVHLSVNNKFLITYVTVSAVLSILSKISM